MITVLLSLLAAVAYGISDFLSGVASRAVHYARIALVVQLTMTASTWVVVGLAGGSSGGGAVMWGLVAGLGTSTGTVLLYRGLGAGQMNVVAPLSAATAALVPVVVGLALGERPSWLVLIGVVLILPAIWLISATPAQPGATARLADGAVDGLLAGVGFAISFVALDRAPDDAGLWPAAWAQLSALAVIAVATSLILRRRGSGRPAGRSIVAAVGAGVLGALAVASFLVASRSGLLVVASVLTSLYPAITVLLAAATLGERTVRAQLVGLALAAGGVVLVVAG
ncbi:DMT family transporter [Cumulibacter manganitolerans]|uniref:DMT family transporter n=1 Tax=Cumulibacter manganitolerans TaxID=1884992 RepID=UPI001E4B3DC0|nr:DMT family transporter [Cumulibacter manganitolerans]